jgi:hypothetical protein
MLLDYAREMCAETFNPETLVWENPGKKPNHFWDCEVMALVGAWELGLRHRRPPDEEKQAIRKAPKAARPALSGQALRAGDRLAAMQGLSPGERLAALRGGR